MSRCGVALPVLAAHLGGTSLTFVMLPALMFRDHHPLLLTADGEFAAKNRGFRTHNPDLAVPAA